MKRIIQVFLTSLFFLNTLNLQAQSEEIGIDEQINQAFEPISNFFSSVIFFEVGGIPFVLLLLVFSALFFTIYFSFVNIRRFPTSINIVRGKYDDVDRHVAANNELAIDGDIVNTF